MMRHQIGFMLAHQVANHVASVDQISSTFLAGRRAAGSEDILQRRSCLSG